MTTKPRNSRPRVECLEDRAVPATLVGLSSDGTALSFFDSASPGVVFSTLRVQGMASGEALVGIDFRPATGVLYGIGSGSNVYTIGTQSGGATRVGSFAGSTPLNGTEFGVDFNPAADAIRIVSNTGQNLRVSPNNGSLLGNDTTLAYDSGDPNAGATPTVTAAAYTNSAFNSGVNASTTTLYDVDAALNLLVRQGGVNVPPGSPSPNTGLLFTVGALGFDPALPVGLDIAGDGTAYLSGGLSGSSFLYTVNLATGAASLLGRIGGIALRDLAVVPTGVPASVLPGVGAPVVVAGSGVGATSGVTVRNVFDASVRFNLDPFPGFAGGVSVAKGDLNGDGVPDFVFGAGAGGLPVVAAYDGASGASLFAFLAYSADFRGGVNVAIGRVIDGTNDIITTPALGSTNVRVFDGGNATLRSSFLAFGTFPIGLSVAAVDTDGNGSDEIIVGVGNGGLPAVGVFTGTGGLARAFLAYDPAFLGGVDVAAARSAAGPVIVTGTAQGTPHVRVFSGFGLELASFFAFTPNFSGGIRVGTADTNGDGFADAVAAGPGAGGLPVVGLFDAFTGNLASSFLAFAGNSLTGVFVD